MIKIRVKEKGGGEQVLTFDRDTVNIGRARGNDIVLPRPNISKRHARIMVTEGEMYVIDLKSTNGTYVNGERIGAPVRVGDDDRVFMGDFMLKVEKFLAEEALLPDEQLKGADEYYEPPAAPADLERATHDAISFLEDEAPEPPSAEGLDDDGDHDEGASLPAQDGDLPGAVSLDDAGEDWADDEAVAPLEVPAEDDQAGLETGMLDAAVAEELLASMPAPASEAAEVTEELPFAASGDTEGEEALAEAGEGEATGPAVEQADEALPADIDEHEAGLDEAELTPAPDAGAPEALEEGSAPRSATGELRRLIAAELSDEVAEVEEQAREVRQTVGDLFGRGATATSLADWVVKGLLDDVMAEHLQARVTAGESVLILGPRDMDTGAFLWTLVPEKGEARNVRAIPGAEEGQPEVWRRLVLSPAPLVVPAWTSREVALWLPYLLERGRGIVASAFGDGTLDTWGARAALQIRLANPGVDDTTARQALAATLHTIVTLTRYPCGTRKVRAIDEVAATAAAPLATRPVFRYVEDRRSPDGKIVGHFEKVSG